MHPIARRIRAAIVMAVLWGIAWAAVGAVLGLTVWLRRPEISLPISMISAATVFASLGALCGAGFAILVAGAERDHTVDDLGRTRIVLWGALAGMACLVTFLTIKGSILMLMLQSHLGALLVNVGIFGALGAVSSYGSLAIARRGTLPAAAEQQRISAK